LIEAETLLVTGAGGCIGSEICRQALRFKPKTLVLVERAENSLFHAHRELEALSSKTQLVACVADVLDRRRMRDIIERYRPTVLFHAAAHKHVPLMESNAGEAIRNNVFGTRRLADLADRLGVRNFVFISTDKAVNPCSVMGATKQIAERYVQALANGSATKFVVVRFGNVLGSTGSVVPIFREQICAGGPITVTHPEMRRYFMTVPEAAQLVLQAFGMGQGGEVFELEMGEPIKILDLAHDMIRLSGLPPDSIPITFTGPRPGEKLFEELYFHDEETLPTAHAKLRAVHPRPFSLAEVQAMISRLAAILHGPEPLVRQELHELAANAKRLEYATIEMPRQSPVRCEKAAGNGSPAKPNLTNL
jgi:FlaA1/EpsC-like NDP-sugar epimerase